VKAIVFHKHGGPDVLTYQEVADPEPSDGQVVVRVMACAINHIDIFTRKGLERISVKLPHVLGADVSGIVVSVGRGVTNVKEGDEVILNPGISCGSCRNCLIGKENLCDSYDILGYRTYDGGYAELCKVPASNCLKKPASLNFVEAASLPLTMMTAWHMLVERAFIRPNDTVLIIAAGSGVGAAALQIAKLHGAFVIATASTDSKLQRAKELGADYLINYAEQDMVEAVKTVTDGRGVDIVVEHVGGKTFENSLKCLAKGGRLVTCGATAGHLTNIDLRHLFYKEQAYLGSFMGIRRDLVSVLEHARKGTIKPIVDSVYSLKDAPKAHMRIENREQFGKVVLVP
jgi:NADPH:quinone reductase-like Zn-dependent oxidoreductase